MDINVRNFVKSHYTQYSGDESFLAKPTKRTKDIWNKISALIKEEQKKGILDLDVNTPSSITSHPPGYIDKDNEIIVGLQTDKPLKRAIKPKGGIKLVEKAVQAYGYKLPDNVREIFTKYQLTHNDAVFKAYTPEHRLLRSKHIITGLPDNYGRGRIIGDYRRLPLYGADALIKQKRRG